MPYTKTFHVILLVGSITSLVINLGLLFYFGALTNPAIVLILGLTNGLAIVYCIDRIRGRVARWFYFIKTPAEAQGIVLNDFFPLILLAASFMATYRAIAP